MKTFVALFLVAGVFGAVIGLGYWFVSHEAAGTALLAVMTGALSFTTAYAVIAERDADLAGDLPGAGRAERAGEDLGVFTKHSPWPVLVACCVLGLLSGVLWSPFVAVASGIGLLLCFWRLGSESAKVTDRSAAG